MHGAYDTCWRELEAVIHATHCRVADIMARTASPGDPSFYLRPCRIGLLWVQWQLAHPGAPFVANGAGLALNDPMAEWPIAHRKM